MKWDVVKVVPQDNMTLSVLFKDGLKGRVRFLESHLTGVFVPLKDPAVFSQVFVNHGAVTWSDGEIDLAPDAMYEEIKKHGEWVLK